MKQIFKILLFFLLLVVTGFTNAQKRYQKLVWNDEFSVTGLPDSSKWGYDTAKGCPKNCGWGNNELQYYTYKNRSNARVENGKLIIEAHKQTKDNAAYTSARLVTKNKGDWKYGRIEVRAKLPYGKGIWPAVWMLPTNKEYGGWPGSGEIDIMEYVGYLPDSVFGTIHTKAYNGMMGTQKTLGVKRSDLKVSYHVYSIEWTATHIKFFIDGQLYHEFLNNKKGNETWPFDKEFHLLMNIAVGGNWGGKFGVDASVFPQKMMIDYVRVYQ